MRSLCFVVTSLLSITLAVSLAVAEQPTPIAMQFAKEARISEPQAQEHVNALFRVIAAELESGREVQIKNFGKFSVRQRAARKGRNPRTGQPLDIPAKKYPKFKAAENLKELVSREVVSESGFTPPNPTAGTSVTSATATSEIPQPATTTAALSQGITQ